ncbi:MAG: antitoxin family protein [Halobacteriota archaeon]
MIKLRGEKKEKKMQKTIEVVYEKGVFKPLEPVEMEEGEKARIEIKRKNEILD